MTVNGKHLRPPASADRQLVVGDRVFTLRYSVRAMAAMQEHFGLDNLTQTAARVYGLASAGANIDDLVALLWAGLRTHHPEITKAEVLNTVDDMGLDWLQVAIAEGLMAAAPEPAKARSRDAESSDRPPVPGPSTG